MRPFECGCATYPLVEQVAITMSRVGPVITPGRQLGRDCVCSGCGRRWP